MSVPDTAAPEISIIVPAWNEERSLPATLDALSGGARALGKAFELLVVNDDSSDRTADVAREHGARVLDVRCRQIAAVRNRGARASRGRVLIFVDADTIVPPETLRAAVAAIDAGAAGGGARVRMDQLPWQLRPLFVLFTLIYHDLARLAAGCFVFASRAAFDAAGGFDEQYLASEEVHLSRALRRQDRFVIPRESITSSARKVRLYRGGGMVRQLLSILLRGPRSLKKREGLGLWYEGRRETASDAAAAKDAGARP